MVADRLGVVGPKLGHPQVGVLDTHLHDVWRPQPTKDCELAALHDPGHLPRVDVAGPEAAAGLVTFGKATESRVVGGVQPAIKRIGTERFVVGEGGHRCRRSWTRRLPPFSHVANMPTDIPGGRADARGPYLATQPHRWGTSTKVSFNIGGSVVVAVPVLDPGRLSGQRGHGGVIFLWVPANLILGSKGRCHAAVVCSATGVLLRREGHAKKRGKNQRLGKISSRPRSPPCGGRSRPPFQAHTAHHAPSLNPETQGWRFRLGGEKAPSFRGFHGFTRIFAGWSEIS
jgi:hypothetical protein